MTIEEFRRADEIVSTITALTEKNEVLKTHIDRVKLYTKMAKDREPVVFAGKKYNQVELNIHFPDSPISSCVDDMFDLIGDNISDFSAFLKKCILNYEKKIKENEKSIEALREEFAKLGTQNEQAA